MDACSKAELRGVDAAGRSGIRQGRQGRIIPRNSRLEFQAALLEDFETSAERRDRLRLLVDAAHGLGLEAEAPTILPFLHPLPPSPPPLSPALSVSLSWEVGVDVPLTLRQQHALNLLPRPSRDREENAAQAGSERKGEHGEPRRIVSFRFETGCGGC